jgi:hypothetical protein
VLRRKARENAQNKNKTAARNKMHRFCALCLTGPFVPALAAVPANAQERPVEEPETMVDSISPKGVRLGSVVAFPRANVGVQYDDNIYNRPNAEHDVLVVARAGVRLVGDLARHAIQFDGATEGRRYFENPAENSNQWSLATKGRLDLADRFTLGADANLARRIERRGSVGDQFLTDRPTAFHEAGVGLNLGRMGGIVEWQASVATRKVTYKDALVDGLKVDQAYRDVHRDTASFKVEYRGFPRLGLFVRATANRLRYVQGSGRDSSGFSVVGGATYRVTDLVSLEAGLGYIRQNARSETRPAINAIDYSLGVSWTPTPRTRFTLNGARSVERSPLPGATSVLESTLEGAAFLAVGRSTLLELDAGLLRNSYEGLDREETRFFVQLSAKRRITSRLSALAGVSARRQTGSGLGNRSYHGAAVRIGITFAL